MTGQPVQSHAESQVRSNQKAYDRNHRSQLEQTDSGRVALMHDGELKAVYNDMGDAYSIGCEKYGLGRFSLVRIGAQPVDLGVHALAMDAATS